MSFDIAAKRLGADTYSISTSTSSMVKGETFLDTVKNLEAMKPDVFVIRHSVSGVPQRIAALTSASVVNAGDGTHEHPTQALLDMLTIKDFKGTLKGLNITIVGDILHSRVAKSNMWGLTKMESEVTLCGPPTLVPREFATVPGVSISYDLQKAIQNADVLMVLRIQRERQKQSFFPSLREYARLYGVTPEKLKKAKDSLLIMHPGPINRGVELDPAVADGPRSVILDQVSNGVAVRMAVLYILAQRSYNQENNGGEPL